MRRSQQDFQKFYYTKVGLGEGCGCAERVIDIHEADRKAGIALRFGLARERLPFRKRWRQALNALGLFRRR